MPKVRLEDIKRGDKANKLGRATGKWTTQKETRGKALLWALHENDHQLQHGCWEGTHENGGLSLWVL